MSELSTAEALHPKEPQKALEHLLGAFRLFRDPKIAELIERLSESLMKPLDGLPPKTLARAEALAQMARDSTDGNRGPVLAAFREFAVGAATGPVGDVIDAWAELEEDPRVAAMATELLTQHGRVRELSANLRRGLGKCLERHGHDGLLPTLERWLIPHQGHGQGEFAPIHFAFTDRSRRLVEKLKKKRKATPVDDPAALVRLDAKIPRRLGSTAPSATARVDGDALLAAIYAAPDDDGPRLTWADWLTEQGDPRGEFIVLQIARARGKVTQVARAREAELLTLHRSRFLGALEPHVHIRGLRFDRGFPTRCEFRFRTPPLAELELLEEVTLADSEPITLERLTRLRKVQGGGAEALVRLLAIAPILTDARLEGDGDIELLAKAPRSLRSLALHTSRPPAVVLPGLLETPAVEALEELELSFDLHVTDTELGLVKPAPLFPAKLLELAPRSLQRFVLVPDPELKLEWSRGATGLDRLRCTIDGRPSGTKSFMVARALAGFLDRPLETVELSLPERPNIFIDSVRKAAKNLVFTG